MKRFTKTMVQSNKTSLSDVISCIMASIEDGFLQSGMIPEKHYSAKCLIDAALPFALASFNKSNIKFTTAWQEDKVKLEPLTIEEDRVIGKLKGILKLEPITLLSKCDYSNTHNILRTSVNGVRVFILNPSYFENVVCLEIGLSKDVVIRVLRDKNLLLSTRGNTCQFTIPKRGYSIEFYTIPAALLKLSTS